MALPELYPFKLLRISSAVGNIILNFGFDSLTFLDVLSALKSVWSSSFSVILAIEDTCATISGLSPCTGTDLSTCWSASQPKDVSLSVSTSCLPGTLPTRAARISEKSYFSSCVTRELVTLYFVLYDCR